MTAVARILALILFVFAEYLHSIPVSNTLQGEILLKKRGTGNEEQSVIQDIITTKKREAVLEKPELIIIDDILERKRRRTGYRRRVIRPRVKRSEVEYRHGDHDLAVQNGAVQGEEARNAKQFIITSDTDILRKRRSQPKFLLVSSAEANSTDEVDGRRKKRSRSGYEPQNQGFVMVDDISFKDAQPNFPGPKIVIEEILGARKKRSQVEYRHGDYEFRKTGAAV